MAVVITMDVSTDCSFILHFDIAHWLLFAFFINKKYTMTVLQRFKMYPRTCQSSEDSYQPEHSHSLIRVLAGRTIDRGGRRSWP